MIGADGARSNVRGSLGIPLEGPRTENAFVIVDTAEDPDDPLPGRADLPLRAPAVDGRNVLFVPFAGHWRVDLQCRPDDDAEAFSGADGVRSWLPLVIDAKYADRVTWVSTYVFLQVLAREFADPTGRVLLVGEAAHLFAPVRRARAQLGHPGRDRRRARDPGRARRGPPARPGRPSPISPTTRRAAAERNREASNEALAHLAPTSAPSRRSAGSRHSRRRAWSAGRPLARRRAVRAEARPADTDGMQY